MSAKIPKYSLDLVGRTDEPGDPTTAVQFAILDPDGTRHAYGDQSWVAAGEPIRDGSHPNGRVVHRSITITYGEWTDPTAELLARARAFLVQCGACDAGLLTACACPQGDPRAVIADLVAEVERLRGGL